MLVISAARSYLPSSAWSSSGSCTPSPAPGSPSCSSATRPTGRSPPTGPPSSARTGPPPTAQDIPSAVACSTADPTTPAPTPPTPSKTSAGGDNPLVANGNSGESGATNLGPRSQTLLTNTQQLVAYWHALGVDNPTPDLVTTSGSGYDPDITPQDAIVQIPMVAKATGIAPASPAGPHQQADQQRPAGLPRQQVHRRPAAQRGPRQTALRP